MVNYIYRFGIALLYLAVKISSLWSDKSKLWIEGRRDCWRLLLENLDPSSRYVWIHVSSLGEFEQGLPLIESIKSRYPEYKIVLTFFSPSGYEVKKNYKGVDLICYIPLDRRSDAKRFLDMVKPEVVFFVKYEFWFNFLAELKSRRIPTYLISALFREKQHFFKWYGSFFREGLTAFTHLFVQDESSVKLLKSVGIVDVTVAGDTRFDRVLEISRSADKIDRIDQFVEDNLVVVVGSSWEQDIDILLDEINSNDKIKWIIAPHVVDDRSISSLRAKLKVSSCCFSSIDIESRVVVVDCYGVLTSLYRYADIAYVGGGFGAGIHNVLEAVVFGTPVLFGPKYHKFLEAKELIKEGGAFSISSVKDFKSIFNQLVDNSSLRENSTRICLDYVNMKSGAIEIILEEVAIRLH